MQILHTTSPDFSAKFKILLARGNMDLDEVSSVVSSILKDIKTKGNSALIEQIARFDKWNPKDINELKIDLNLCEDSFKKLDSATKNALELAYERIYSFHAKQREKSWIDFEPNGNMLGVKITPLNRAGLYIPGGKAAYPSSLLMNAIPAIVAGVKEIIVCTPAPNNELNHLLLAAIYLCGIKEAYKIGGASAIGLMAYGTESIKKTDVVTGPGNIFVACAKKLVFGEVNIDMIAGPSEIAIIADSSANPTHIALDLLSQAEHDEMASSILITPSEILLDSVKNEIEKILPTLSRTNIAQASIKNRAALIKARDLCECVKLSNEIAPEHLEIVTSHPHELLAYIKNAGAIFLGAWSTEAIGDYIAGPNHTLPTGGSARFYSPLGVEHFIKKSSIINISARGALEIGDCVEKLADCEGLQAHKMSVQARLNDLRKD